MTTSSVELMEYLKLRQQADVLRETALQNATREISGLESKLASATSRADAFQRALKAAEARIISLERGTREKCEELAEKAGRIRELEEDNGQLGKRVVELEEMVVEGGFETARLAGQLKAANDERDAFRDAKIRTGSRLLAAIEDGIAHVEAGRMALLYSNCPISEHQVAFNALDLAHEALSGAVAGSRPTLSPETAASLDRVKDLLDDLKASREPGLAERGAGLEEDLGRLGAAATNPAGKPPSYARLDSLEESRGNHAVMLTDHADRLAACEKAISKLRLSVDADSLLSFVREESLRQGRAALADAIVSELDVFFVTGRQASADDLTEHLKKWLAEGANG